MDLKGWDKYSLTCLSKSGFNIPSKVGLMDAVIDRHWLRITTS
jgi:hypothetical protein